MVTFSIDFQKIDFFLKVKNCKLCSIMFVSDYLNKMEWSPWPEIAPPEEIIAELCSTIEDVFNTIRD